MAAGTKGRLEASLCEGCYEVFFSKKLFDSHIQKCSEPRSTSQAATSTNPVGSSTLSKCATCRRIFLGGQNLEKHVKKEHNTRKIVTTVLSCFECKHLFMDAEKLAKHKEQEHPGPAPSAAAITTAAQPKKLEVAKKPKPKVVTISEPTMVSKIMEAMPKLKGPSKVKMTPKVDCEPKQESDSKSEPKPDPEAKSMSQDPKTPSKPAAEVVPMPVLDVDSDETQLTDGLTSDQDPRTGESESEAIDVPSAKSPPMPEEDSSRSAGPAGAAETVAEDKCSSMTEVVAPVDQSSTEPGDISATETTAATTTHVVVAAETPTKMPPTASTSVSPGVFFACGSCNFMFSDKNKLLRHLKEEHGRQAKSAFIRTHASVVKKPNGRWSTLYACPMCDVKCPTGDLIRLHIEARHSTTPRNRTVKNEKKSSQRGESVWSTRECVDCSSLYKPSERLRDIYMKLSEWTAHFYGSHGTTEKTYPVKWLELRPCNRCGLVFINNATRLHHNVISHAGRDPEAAMKKKQKRENRELVATAEVTPKSMTPKARSQVIVDSLMKASLVSSSASTVTMGKVAGRKSSGQRVTNVVFKCSKCGGMFPDDPSFERHAREAHGGTGRAPDASSPPFGDPPPNSGEWDVLKQRECSDCSKLMESCPRSFGLFVRRDVWERHVNEVHVTGVWRCTGDQLQLHPCSHCPRLFLHPSSLEAHQAKLHDTMLGPVRQVDVEACSLTNTLECSRCSQLVQDADGLRFLDHSVWSKHFETEHKELLLCDGKAGEWQLFPCSKCQRLFFSEQDIPKHEARQAYMHVPVPATAKVTPKRGHRVAQETQILYQCANDNCPFTSSEHESMVSHFKECSESAPAKIGETVLYKTVMVRKPPRKRPKPRRGPSVFKGRMENAMQKLAPGSSTDGGKTSAADGGVANDEPSEAAAAVSQLLQAEPGGSAEPAVLELDPVTCQPRLAHPLQAAEDVPEAAAEEETVAAEDPLGEGSSDAAAGQHTRMDFACSVCNVRGSTKEEIAMHIRREHKRKDGTFGPSEEEARQQQVQNYKHAYLCTECKEMAEPCPRTRDLYFEKAAWLDHLNTSHKPMNLTELDRLDLHECEECAKLFLSNASLKRHSRAYHEPGAENYQAPWQQKEERRKKYKFCCLEQGCTFRYHRVTKLRSHLIDVHNFDLAEREVVFNNENEFQEWKKTFELNTNAMFPLRSNVQAKRKEGTFNVRYFGCSRVMTNLPTQKRNGKKLSVPWKAELLKEDMVWRCPAFMKAEVAENSTAVNVTFCPNHYGHDMDPSFGRLTDAEEAEIGGMLRAGLNIPDVLKRMREEGRNQGTPTRKQRVTEAELNIIYQKYMGTKPRKLKRYGPMIGETVSLAPREAGLPSVTWDADLVTSYEADMDAQDTVGEELSVEATEAADEGVVASDAWKRVCGEEDCRFTTTSVGFLRTHLRQRHGFAMHIDSAGFASMKDFTCWKRNLEKRTCAKYTCYKSVAPSDPSDPVVTRYYTCHRSGLNSLKRAQSHAPLPRRLVLCTGYMKVRCDSTSGAVACEYCASHYGHDARLTGRRVAEQEPSEDLVPVEYETVEDDGEVPQSMVDHFGSPQRNQFGSPSAARYSFIHGDLTVSDQEVVVEEEQPPRRPRGRPPKKKRPAPPRRSRGGKRRRWEEVDEVEEFDEEEQQQEDSFESD